MLRDNLVDHPDQSLAEVRVRRAVAFSSKNYGSIKPFLKDRNMVDSVVAYPNFYILAAEICEEDFCVAHAALYLIQSLVVGEVALPKDC